MSTLEHNMVHELPADLGTQVTALNFGATLIDEAVVIEGVPPAPVMDMITGAVEGSLTVGGKLSIRLAGYKGKSYLIGRDPIAQTSQS